MAKKLSEELMKLQEKYNSLFLLFESVADVDIVTDLTTMMTEVADDEFESYEACLFVDMFLAPSYLDALRAWSE